MSRGLGRVEVIAIVGAVAVCLVAASVLLSKSRALAIRDATQLNQIHAAFITFSREYEPAGELLLPSRLALQAAGKDGPQDEDFTLNHTANIYSKMVMQNYFTPELLISPLERSPHVRVKDSFSWERYDPIQGILWDESFVMRLDDPAIGANASYALEAAVGDRRKVRWRDSLDVWNPVFGTRAPGRAPAKVPPRWTGNFVFADNHVEQLGSFFHSVPAGSLPADNFYAADLEHPRGPHAAADIFLAIYIGATEFSVEDVYDP